MKRKVVSVLMCAAMATTLLAGCGGNSSESTSSANSGSTTESSTSADSNSASSSSAADSSSADSSSASSSSAAVTGDLSGAKGMHFEIVAKGFQHSYWQAVLKGAQSKADELGVTINFVGPNSESDTADQVQMLNSAIQANPDAIGLAALNTDSVLDSLNSAMDAGIPIVGLDSGVPDAPEGSVLANASTDNYAAGELAAEETYKLLSDRIANADGSVRIGVMAQDSVSESIINRGLGFIDKIAELITADGKTVSIEGNDKYVTDSKVESTDGADVVIEVVVPSTVTAELSQNDATGLLNKEDTICIYASNQFSGEGLVSANNNLQKLGSGDDQILGVAFDSGPIIAPAVQAGTLAGAITQAPVHMGEVTVELLAAAALGQEVSDVDTGCQWYTADNMENEEIAQNLYWE